MILPPPGPRRHHWLRDCRQLHGLPPYRPGWTDVVLLDKGPLPNPGGSTGHASNFIFPVDHSKEMTQLTLESVRQYKEIGVFTEWGGIEVARTQERMQELQRRMTSAKSWGIEPVSIVSPAEVKELVPYIDETVILGGFYTPSSASLTRCEPERSCASAARSRALTVVANIEVAGIDVEGGRVRRCTRTTATSILRPSSSLAACGARGSRAWPVPRFR